MDFYTALSHFYDSLFPLEPQILDFLLKHLSSCKKILDIACGTGTYTLALAEAFSKQGISIVGIDLSQAMIDLARQKLMQKIHFNKTYSGLKESEMFRIGDMLNLSSFGTGTFDGVYCIGNSLVHLETIEQIHKALTEWYRVLQPEGLVIVQIVNFDRVQFDNQDKFSLPPLKAAKVELERYYTPGPDPDHVYFQTTLLFSKNLKAGVSGALNLSMPFDQPLENRVSLYRLKRDMLRTYLTYTGFYDLHWYGSYDGTAYDPSSSFLTLVVAKKSTLPPLP
ncbi:MAG: class I SAM-dependent methyltransferase [Spirochaetales bacterium]